MLLSKTYIFFSVDFYKKNLRFLLMVIKCKILINAVTLNNYSATFA